MATRAGLRAVRRALVVGLSAAVALLFGRAVLALPREPAGLTALVETHLPEAGVEHGVTAVLLNFRGYDTWLELGVLFLALVGSLGAMQLRGPASAAPFPPGGALLSALGRALFPPMVLVAGYFLWLGKFSAGGAFQAGVVLGAALVLLWLSGASRVALAFTHWSGRVLVALGLLAFFLTAIASLLRGGPPLAFSPDAAGTIISLIELMAALSIGFTLAGLLIAPRLGPQQSSHSTAG